MFVHRFGLGTKSLVQTTIEQYLRTTFGHQEVFTSGYRFSSTDKFNFHMLQI